MTREIWLIGASCLLPATVLAVAVALSNPVGAQTGAAQQAGVSAAVRGQVDLFSVFDAEPEPDPLAGGEQIFLGDQVRSARESGMQILLLDESVFTVGENSQLAIDEFVYQPEDGAGTVAARLVEGTFRFVSGQVAADNPDNVRIQLPSGVIGIRGTTAVVRIIGEEVLILLEGPGGDDPQSGSGLINVTAGGHTVTLFRSGFATVVSGDNPPETPFRLPPGDLETLISGLEQGTVPGDGEDDQVDATLFPSDESGYTFIADLSDLDELDALNAFLGALAAVEPDPGELDETFESMDEDIGYILPTGFNDLEEFCVEMHPNDPGCFDDPQPYIDDYNTPQ